MMTHIPGQDVLQAAAELSATTYYPELLQTRLNLLRIQYNIHLLLLTLLSLPWRQASRLCPLQVALD